MHTSYQMILTKAISPYVFIYMYIRLWVGTQFIDKIEMCERERQTNRDKIDIARLGTYVVNE